MAEASPRAVWSHNQLRSTKKLVDEKRRERTAIQRKLRVGNPGYMERRRLERESEQLSLEIGRLESDMLKAWG